MSGVEFPHQSDEQQIPAMSDDDAMVGKGEPKTTGRHGEYAWIESRAVVLDDLLSKCPEFVFGYRLAITSCDSGPMRISEALAEMGWTFENQVAVSPKNYFDSMARRLRVG